jgi:hypothetical protein
MQPILSYIGSILESAHNIFFFFACSFLVWDWTQHLAHARQVLYHWAIFQPSYYLLNMAL